MWEDLRSEPWSGSRERRIKSSRAAGSVHFLIFFFFSLTTELSLLLLLLSWRDFCKFFYFSRGRMGFKYAREGSGHSLNGSSLTRSLWSDLDLCRVAWYASVEDQMGFLVTWARWRVSIGLGVTWRNTVYRWRVGIGLCAGCDVEKMYRVRWVWVVLHHRKFYACGVHLDGWVVLEGDSVVRSLLIKSSDLIHPLNLWPHILVTVHQEILLWSNPTLERCVSVWRERCYRARFTWLEWWTDPSWRCLETFSWSPVLSLTFFIS